MFTIVFMYGSVYFMEGGNKKQCGDELQLIVSSTCPEDFREVLTFLKVDSLSDLLNLFLC